MCQITAEQTPQACLLTTTAVEDVPMNRKILRKLLESDLIADATKKGHNLQPLLNMVHAQKWDTLNSCYGQYFYPVRDRLSVRDGILLYDDRAVIPKQLRQVLVDLLLLTHPGQSGLLEAAKNVWYPYLCRDIVDTAQICKECRQKGKNFQVHSRKQHFTALDAVVEPDEGIRVGFRRTAPRRKKGSVYAGRVNRFSRFPSAKVVTNNKADIIIRFMQTHIVNHGVLRNIGCAQAQENRAKKLTLNCKIILLN